MTTLNHGPLASEPDPDTARTWAILAHLALLISMVISAGWLGFVGPLVLWIIYKDRSPFVRNAAAGSFNFAVTLTIVSWIAWICVFTIILIPVAIVLGLALLVLSILLPILAALRASRGEMYRYPLTIPILR